MLTLSYAALIALPLVAALSISSPQLDARNNGGLSIYLKNGSLIGASLPTFNQEFFGGIRYAAIPKRFEPPKPASAYNGTFNATGYTSPCWGTGNAALGMQSEDCLSLNIIRPAGTNENSKLPVLFWMHGGGFWGGSGRDQSNNGSYVVQTSVTSNQPIIFVSINYRLLTFGFPNGIEAHKAGIENLGLLDQRVALQWVQENIGAFGGDAGRVTIQGESAGGTSIVQQLVAYGGRDDKLFSAAIIQSGSFYNLSCAVDTGYNQERNYKKLLNETGCAGLECLRTLDVEKLANVSLKYYTQFLPVVDGNLFKKHPVELWNEGAFIKVPLLMGSNQDEGTILSILGIQNDTALLSAITSENTTSYTMNAAAFPALLAAYPNDPRLGAPQGTGRGVLASGAQDKRSNIMFGDAIEDSPRRWLTGLMAAAGQPTFSYIFRQVPYGYPISIGATHAAELGYVWGNPLGVLFDPLGEDESLSKVMRGLWSSFVANHNPNRDGLPYWPDYRYEKSNMGLKINASAAEPDTYRKEGIQLWIDQRIAGCSGIKSL